MKRFILFLFGSCFFITPLRADLMADMYRRWMLEDINRANYEKAFADMQHASFEYAAEDENVYVPYFDAFIDYAISHKAGDDKIRGLYYYESELFAVFALSYMMNNQYPEAEQWLIRSCEELEKAVGEKSTDYITRLGELASYYIEMQAFSKALQYSQKSSNLAKKYHGIHSDVYLRCTMDLATLYYSMGKYSESEKLYLLCESIYEKRSLESELSYGALMSNLGNLLIYQGDYDRAEIAFKKSIDCYKKLFKKC